MSVEEISELSALCDQKLKVIEQDVRILAAEAAKLSKLSSLAKATTIILGALIATSGAAASIWGDNSVGVLLFYTGLGVVIAAIGGLDAAFKLEERSSALRLLTADVTAKTTTFEVERRQLEIEAKRIGPQDTERIETLMIAAHELLDRLAEYIIYYQRRAAELGVNLQRSNK